MLLKITVNRLKDKCLYRPKMLYMFVGLLIAKRVEFKAVYRRQRNAQMIRKNGNI